MFKLYVLVFFNSSRFCVERDVRSETKSRFLFCLSHFPIQLWWDRLYCDLTKMEKQKHRSVNISWRLLLITRCALYNVQCTLCNVHVTQIFPIYIYPTCSARCRDLHAIVLKQQDALCPLFIICYLHKIRKTSTE